MLILVDQFVNKLKSSTRKSIDSHKCYSTKLETILRATAKELDNNNDVTTHSDNNNDVLEKKARKRSISESSSDCDTTQAEDLPGTSLVLRKKSRLNSNSFIYVEGKEDSPLSSVTESSENIALEEINLSRALRLQEFEICVSNESFIENLAQTINKAMDTTCTPRKPEQPKNDENVEQNQQDQQIGSLTGAMLDELIRNVLEDTEKDPTFNDIVADAVGERSFYLKSNNILRDVFFADFKD